MVSENISHNDTNKTLKAKQGSSSLLMRRLQRALTNNTKLPGIIPITSNVNEFTDKLQRGTLTTVNNCFEITCASDLNGKDIFKAARGSLIKLDIATEGKGRNAAQRTGTSLSSCSDFSSASSRSSHDRLEIRRPSLRQFSH